MKRFKKFRDDRFALTTLQNPLCDPQTQADLAQAAQAARQAFPRRAENPATLSPINSTSAASNPPAPDPPAPEPHAAAPASPNSQNGPAQQPANESLGQSTEQQDESYEYAIVVPAKAALTDETALPPAPKPRKTAKSRKKPKPRPKSDAKPAYIQEFETATRLNEMIERAKRMGVLRDDYPSYGNAPLNPNRYDTGVDTVEDALSEQELAELSPLQRHSRKCAICRHPQRQHIEEEFVNWRRPKTIMEWFGIRSRTTIYYHAHAFGLAEQRARNLRAALGNLIEKAEICEPTVKDAIQLIRMFAHVNAQGEWVQPVNRSEVRSENRSEVVLSGKRSPVSSKAEEILIATANY